MSEKATTTERPYVGLIPFREEDARYFFGRAKEQEIITGNLLASRLTLLYGASGVGKSSVLRAGVVHRLRELAEGHMARRGRPKFVVVFFNSWSDDPVAGTLKSVEAEAARLFPGQTFEPLPAEMGFVERLREWSRRVQGQLLVIYDQFEEYFLYHPNEDGAGTFAAEFPRAVNTPGLSVNFLVSYREDAHAKLDFFKGRIPDLFENYFRIEHLDAEAAREAIVRPLDRYNERPGADAQPPVTIEQQLVGAILREVEAGRVVWGEAGRGVVSKAAGAKSEVETPYLQLVMTRLWDEETGSGSRVLRLSTLERLGGAQNIVRSHLDATMTALPPQEQDIAANIFHYLVTPSGTKIAHGVRDLAEYARIPKEKLEPVLDKLSGSDVRILRPIDPPPDQPNVVRYEIFHDVLAAAILDWRARYVQQQERREAERQAEEQRRKTAEQARAAEQARVAVRLRALVGALAVMFLLAAGAAGFAFTQSRLAEQQRQRAVKNEQEALRQRGYAEEQRLNAERHRGIAEDRARRLEVSQTEATAAKNKAEEQSRLAERERARAVEQKQRADEQAEIARRQKERADHEARLAHAQEAEAKRQKGYAEEERRRADALARVSFSRELASAATGKINADPELGVLLALRSLQGALPGGAEAPQGWEHQHDDAAAAAATTEAAAPGSKVITREAEEALHQVVQASRVRRTFRGQTDVNRIAFSPDHRHVAAASPADGSLKILDTAAGSETQVVRPEAGREGGKQVSAFEGLTYSPDGRLLAGYRSDGTVKVWDAATGKELPSAATKFWLVKSVAFSPDGGRLAVVTYDDKGRLTPVLWDYAAGRRVELPYPDGNHAMRDITLTFDPDRRTLTLGGCQVAGTDSWCVNFRVDTWDSETGQANEQHAVRVGDETTAPAANSANSLGTVVDAALSVEKMLIATVSPIGKVSLWNAATGERLRNFNTGIRRSPAWFVAISPAGDYVAAYSYDGTVKMWRAETGGVLVDVLPSIRRASDDDDEAGVARVLFSPDGTRLAGYTSWDGAVRVWDTQTGEELARLLGHAGGVNRAAFSADSRQLVTGSADDTVKVWDIVHSHELQTIKVGRLGVSAVAYSPDGRSLVSAGSDGKTKVWNVADGRQKRVLAANVSRTLSVAYSPDGARLLTTSRDGVARLWDVETGAARELCKAAERQEAEKAAESKGGRRSAERRSDPLWDAAFSPDGRRFVAGAEAGRAFVCDVQTGEKLFDLADASATSAAGGASAGEGARAHGGAVYGVAYSRDGRLIATASADKTVKLWDAADGKLLATLPGLAGENASHADEVWDVAFSPDSRLLATASHDRTARVWDISGLRSGALPAGPRVLVGHNRWLWCVAFSPDGGRVATGSSDGTTKIWDAKTGEELLTLTGHTSAVTRVAYSPDGRHLATSGEDGTVREYTLDLEELKRLARARVSRDLTDAERAKYLHEKNRQD